MAGSRVLEIIATLQDKVTDKIDQMEQGFGRLAKQLQSSGHHAVMMGRTMEQVGRSMIFTGAALTGPLALAFNASAQYSQRVADQIDRLKGTTAAFQLSLANAMLPVIERFNNVLASLVNAWNRLTPAQQNSIVQTIFLTGTFLTLGGTIVTVAGAVVKFIGELERLTAMQLMFIQKAGMVVLVTAAWIAAIVLLIVFWDKLKGVAIPVLNGIQIAIDMVAIGFQKMLAFAVDGAIRLTNALSDVFMALGSVQGPQQQMFLGIANGMQKASGALHVFYSAQQKTILDLQNNITNILVTGKGALSTGVDSMISKIKNLFANLNNAFSQSTNVNAPIKYFNALQEIVQQTAQSMTTSFGEGFFDVMTGNLSDLKNVFANWGQQILKIIANVLAKLLILHTIGTIGIGGGKTIASLIMHSGGMIQRAHSGMLAYDEVPIIAQTGEAVLSRRAVATLGADNVNRLNSGQGIGGGQNTTVTIQINPVIQAWDTSDIMRNRKAISAAIAEDLRSNAQIRQTIRQYS